MASVLSKNYAVILNSLKEKIRNARLKAVLTANAQLLEIYWEIGKVIEEQEKTEGWGAKTVDRLSVDLKTEFEDMKGLSPRNLRYMRDFYLAYPIPDIWQQAVAKKETVGNEPSAILQQAVAKLPWGHHTVIITKAKALDERTFYIQKCVENNWSRNVLSAQIESDLYDRSGTSINNFNNTLTAPQSDLAVATFKNPYLFDFLAMGERIQERELEKALIAHLKKFMLELGKGFAYMGNQHNLNIEGDDYFLDLLFYNTHMHCYVVFELKIGEFEPEFAGKLNFYINTIDAEIKGKEDKPTIGVLLCKTPNETVVKYALQGIQTPMGISEFHLELADVLPKQLKGEMPTVEELEKEIEQGYEELKSPSDKKIDRLKELLKELKHPELKEKKDEENTKRIFERVVAVLEAKMLFKLESIEEMFQSVEMGTAVDSYGFPSYDAAEIHLREKNRYNSDQFKIEVVGRGLKQAGIKAFDSWSGVQISLQEYKYQVSFIGKPNEIILEKLYHEFPTGKEEDEVVEKWMNFLLDEITQGVERIRTEMK